MNRYANTPEQATRQELINLLFLKASEVAQSGLVDLTFHADGQCNGTPHVSWYVGNARNPDAGNYTDTLHLINTPSKYRVFDEDKCREFIDALHELLFNAVNQS